MKMLLISTRTGSHFPEKVSPRLPPPQKKIANLETQGWGENALLTTLCTHLKQKLKLNFFSEDGNKDKKSKSSCNKSSNSKYRNRKKYNSSDEESEEPTKLSRKKNANSSNKTR